MYRPLHFHYTNTSDGLIHLTHSLRNRNRNPHPPPLFRRSFTHPQPQPLSAPETEAIDYFTTRGSTPLSTKLSSSQLNENWCLNVRTLEKLLGLELESGTSLEGVKELVEAIFPDQLIPFPVNAALLYRVTNG